MSLLLIVILAFQLFLFLILSCTFEHFMEFVHYICFIIIIIIIIIVIIIIACNLKKGTVLKGPWVASRHSGKQQEKDVRMR